MYITETFIYLREYKYPYEEYIDKNNARNDNLDCKER